MTQFLSRGLPSAGIFAGPAAWFISQQANYAAVIWSCGHHTQLAYPITAITFLIALSGAGLSGRAMQRGGDEPRFFLASVGFGMALLFCCLILLQVSAAFILDGCER